MRRGGVLLCRFGLRRGMFLQLLILLPPAAYLWGSNLILSPMGNFLSIAKESHQRTPAETDGFWRHFFILFAAVGKKYAVGDTFPAQSTVVGKKYAVGAESVQGIMEDAAFACCTLRAHRFPLYRLLWENKKLFRPNGRSLFLRGIMAAPPGLGQFFPHAVIAVSFILHYRTTCGISTFCRLRVLIFFPLYTILAFFTSQRVKYPPYRE